MATARKSRPTPLEVFTHARQRKRKSPAQPSAPQPGRTGPGLPVKVLLTGAHGQAGRELSRTAPDFVELLCLDRNRLDITDAAAVVRTVRAEKPALLINAAAYTAVDRAEGEREQAFAVNATGAGNLAAAAGEVGARFIHLSTDFVFDGAKSSPYQSDDRPNPLGIYGASKLAGELAVRENSPGALIVRTSWLYSAHGHNFVKTMLRLLAEREELQVVADQVGTPTWAGSLARALWAAAARPELHGIYHWSDAGVAGWYDFAQAIQEEALQLDLLSRAIPINPITTDAYPTAARRPAYSVLDKSPAWRDLAISGQHWRVTLRIMLKELAGHT